MLREIKFKKKPIFIEQLEKSGGTDYRLYEYQYLTIIDGKEPKKHGKGMVRHITVNSKKRYRASDEELHMIAKELLPKDANYKFKKSFFVKTVAHIYEV